MIPTIVRTAPMRRTVTAPQPNGRLGGPRRCVWAATTAAVVRPIASGVPFSDNKGFNGIPSGGIHRSGTGDRFFPRPACRGHDGGHRPAPSGDPGSQREDGGPAVPRRAPDEGGGARAGDRGEGGGRVHRLRGPLVRRVRRRGDARGPRGPSRPCADAPPPIRPRVLP